MVKIQILVHPSSIGYSLSISSIKIITAHIQVKNKVKKSKTFIVFIWEIFTSRDHVQFTLVLFILFYFNQCINGECQGR